MREAEGGGANGETPFGRFAEMRALPPYTGLVTRLIILAICLIIAFALLSVARGVYTDLLWFSSINLQSVYTTVLFTQIWLFLAGFLVMGGLITLSFWIAFRTIYRSFEAEGPESTLLWLRRVLFWSMGIVGFLISIVFASALSGRWELFLRFVNATRFEMLDPLFNKDVGFYIFTMPLLHTIQGWLMSAAIVILLSVGSVYFLIYSIRDGLPWNSRTPLIHTALLSAFLMFTIAGGHYLDIFETLFSTGGAVVGATATDVSARIPMLWLLTSVALLSGLIMLATLRVSSAQQSIRLLLVAFSLWVVAGLLGGLAVPVLYQRFIVDPGELERERIYIEQNIAWTRYGFDLDRVSEQPYSVRDGELAYDLINNPETVNNIRLWDPRPLLDVYNQLQHLRLYYNFQDVDVDRYVINGDYRQVLLGTRELIPEGLDPSAQSWVNRKLVYTHGYGVVMSPATDFTTEGQPTFFIKDIPPQGDFPVEQPRIYYGENTNGFVVVNSREAQFDRPAINPGEPPVYIDQYEGLGGVSLSNLFRRAAYAWEFADVNILISNQLTQESKILYRRNVSERIATVAPFLRLDRDPYMVVDNGHLFWIQDAYTFTDRLPYSKRLGNRDFNYIRNSVKAVVDAHDGTVTFYTIEPVRPDPLLRVYENIFPELFRPISTMPTGLRAHIRYPERLLRAQATTFLQYHMTDPKEFFLKEDQWEIPDEVVFEGLHQPVNPYYVIMKLPGQDREEFVMILPFTPQDKPNLVAWMAARSDGEHYGDILLYTFPTERLFNGPSQVEARIDNDPAISEQFTLWGQSGSMVIRGNLLVIPIGQSLLYAEPIYLQAENLEFPELKRVILASTDHVVMESTLQKAVAALLSRQEVPDIPSDGGGLGAGTTDQLLIELGRLSEALEELQGSIHNLDDSLENLKDLARQEV